MSCCNTIGFHLKAKAVMKLVLECSFFLCHCDRGPVPFSISQNFAKDLRLYTFFFVGACSRGRRWLLCEFCLLGQAALMDVWHFRGSASFRASQISDRDRLPITPRVSRPLPLDVLAFQSLYFVRYPTACSITLNDDLSKADTPSKKKNVISLFGLWRIGSPLHVC